MKDIKDAVERLRQQLERSAESLLGGQNPRLLSALRTVRPGLTKAFIVHHIPEQGEDIYTVVTGKDQIVTVEIDRTSDVTEPEVKVLSVREYRAEHPHLPKVRRRELEMALELLRQSDEMGPG